MFDTEEKRCQPPSKRLRHYLPSREFDVRQAADGKNEVVFGGYAIRWDKATVIYDWLGSFTEVFRRDAFKKTRAERGPLRNGRLRLSTN